MSMTEPGRAQTEILLLENQLGQNQTYSCQWVYLWTSRARTNIYFCQRVCLWARQVRKRKYSCQWVRLRAWQSRNRNTPVSAYVREQCRLETEELLSVSMSFEPGRAETEIVLSSGMLVSMTVNQAKQKLKNFCQWVCLWAKNRTATEILMLVSMWVRWTRTPSTSVTRYVSEFVSQTETPLSVSKYV